MYVVLCYIVTVATSASITASSRPGEYNSAVGHKHQRAAAAHTAAATAACGVAQQQAMPLTITQLMVVLHFYLLP